MSDLQILREMHPCGSSARGEDVSSSNFDTLEIKLMPLCVEVAPGLADAEPISSNSNLRKRNNSHLGTSAPGNDVENSIEKDTVVGAKQVEEKHGQSSEIKEEKERALQQPELATHLVPFSEMILRPKMRKLVLHIDLNNTVLVSDAVINQDPRAALNCYLSSVTWGKISPTGEWQWLSPAPSLLPPCPDALSFCSQYGRSPDFTDTPIGQQFQGLHTHHLKLLEWQGQPHPLLSLPGEQAKHYHLVLPAFFRLLESLHREGRHFAVVFRTFGTDLPRVLKAVHCALEGQHPHFPALWDISLPVDVSPGKIRCSKQRVVLNHGGKQLSTKEGDRDMYVYLSSREGLCGFQDHFEWWARNEFSSRGGKPLWIDPYDTSVHHICIDDNIRLNDSDTIVRPQVFSGQGSHYSRPTSTSELYDICLVQTDLLEAIADVDYFCHCVRRCEENYENFLATAGSYP